MSRDDPSLQKLEYASPETNRRSRSARISDMLTWLLAWLLALIVLGGLCVGPMLCDPPRFFRDLD